jgi:hypothetical protein
MIGPLQIEWSRFTDGLGYLYFGPFGPDALEYEIGPTKEADITSIDASKITFLTRDDHES